MSYVKEVVKFNRKTREKAVNTLAYGVGCEQNLAICIEWLDGSIAVIIFLRIFRTWQGYDTVKYWN